MKHLKLRPTVLGTIVLTLTLLLTLGTSLAQPVSRPSAHGAAQGAQPGAEVFKARCAVCHGTLASGKMGPPLNVLPPEIASLPPQELTKELTGLIRGGIPGRMPMFTPDLVSDEQVGQLVEFFLSINGTLPGPSLDEAMAPVAAESVGDRTFYAATGHSIGGEFRTFWRRYDGLRVFGLPLTEEYMGVSPEDGKPYRMQLFERARFELHPELPAGQQVLLALLGAEELRLRTHFHEEHP
jgi:mono/diheme cytochrome c family protein